MSLLEIEQMVSQNQNETEMIIFLRRPYPGFHLFKEPYRYSVYGKPGLSTFIHFQPSSVNYHSWMIPKRSPLLEKFQMDLMWMWDSGVKAKLEGDSTATDKSEAQPKVRENVPLDLVQTAPMFLILAMGAAVAIVVFTIESCTRFCETKKKESAKQKSISRAWDKIA